MVNLLPAIWNLFNLIPREKHPERFFNDSNDPNDANAPNDFNDALYFPSRYFSQLVRV